MYKNVTLEVSLKPFTDTSKSGTERVCRRIFSQWNALIKDAPVVSVLLWCADGSEILEYNNDLSAEIEWCKFVGGANKSEWFDPACDPDNEDLHSAILLYTDNPPVITYQIIKDIIKTFKKIGNELYPDKTIRLGATFDPGPEFAVSRFKYIDHRELCFGQGAEFIYSYAVLNGDSKEYASYPDGIPDKTPFALFFGKQLQCYLSDMGFDYVWLSNGFGFGVEPWRTSGPIFDGKKFYGEKIDEIKAKILESWETLHRECSFPIEVRGTNFSIGIDYSTDGFSAADIISEDYGVIMPPPNSPWAALDKNFGLEIMGHLTRISKKCRNGYMFRYYIHDPWWANSPWYDRYEGYPHDIYLPSSLIRTNEDGTAESASQLNLLTIDNSFGEMPDSCVNEVIPHLLSGIKDCGDEIAPVMWIYPFDRYTSAKDSGTLGEMFFGDWFMCGAINEGFPVSGVITEDNFIKAVTNGVNLKKSVMALHVPNAGSDIENAVIKFIAGGGKCLFYGSVKNAGEKIKSLLGIDVGSGNCECTETEICKTYDTVKNGSYPKKFVHRDIMADGALQNVCAKGGNAIAMAGGSVIAAYSENCAWVRGSISASFKAEAQLLCPDDRTKYFTSERLMRYALSHLGFSVLFEKENAQSPSPVITAARNNNAYMYSVFMPDTTVKVKLKTDIGCPIIKGYETVIENGYSTYHFPRAFHGECRFFVEQESGVVSARELPHISRKFRRKLIIDGLNNATVRVFVEKYCVGNAKFVLNEPEYTGEKFEGKWVSDEHGDYYEIKNITGTLRVSMPMKKTLPVVDFD